MKIKTIRAYQVDLPLKEDSYNWSGGKSVSVFDSTVIEVITDSGLIGYGEVCPLGPFYLPAYAGGVRAGIAELGPKLIGHNPLQLAQINRLMDQQLLGHPYVKSGIDMACWDLLGKQCEQPLTTLLGGRYADDFVLYRAVSQRSPDEMAANIQKYRDEGYRRFQLKVGGDPDVDIARMFATAEQLQPGEKLVADANTGWIQHEAARVVNAVSELSVYIEQPCKTYEECLTIRKRCAMPFVLDENIDCVEMLLRAHQDGAADVVNLKISKLGGISKMRQLRDLCVRFGIAMTIEDSWGGDIVTAAISHMAHSTPTELLFSSTDFNSYGSVSIANGAPQRNNGRMSAPTSPGLGIEPIFESLGEPVLEIS